jgi:outer membrane protein TolC
LGARSGHWPILQLRAKSSLDYPDGPNLRQVHQDTIMLNMDWPLFEFGEVSSKVAAKRAEALGALHQKEQEALDLTRDWTKANARLDSLLQQRQSADLSVSRGKELARLKFSAYRLGKSSFSEVQTINLELLEAQIRKAQIEAQMLIQYHSLRFLAEKENL